MFFEAVEVLFTGKAEEWLDTVPRLNKFTDQEDEPKETDVEEFKQALMKRLPKKLKKDVENVQEDIQNLKQGQDETLIIYHERAQDLLQRSNGRDDADNTGADLSDIEKTMLSIIVRAFIRGIRNDNLRSMIMMKSSIFNGSLQGAFEKTKKAVTTIAQIEEIQRERLESRELENFRNHYTTQ